MPDVNGNDRFDSGTDNLLAEFDYTLRADGRRTGAAETFFSDNQPLTTNNWLWSYDSMGRLIGETLDSSDNTLDYTDTFEWDIVGNRVETTRDWGDVSKDDYATTYQYDANDRLTVETKVEGSSTTSSTYSYDYTQQSGKSVVTDGVPKSNQIFEYDVQGRMSRVVNQTLDSGGAVIGVQTTEYEYDTAGNRVVATNTVDSNNDGTPESVTRTEYLTDSNNHTGYSQVIEETEFDANGNPVKKIVYTIGHDQISQTVFVPSPGGEGQGEGGWGEGTTAWFAYDGHGSVRVLYDALAAIITSAASVLQRFHFDAHGNLLNMQALQALTSYLYSGEAFDTNIGQQYLRARWYNASTGRFNRLDPFFGNLSDPQSLHKYLYVHGDPIQGIDPSGLEFSLAGLQTSIGTIGRNLSLQGGSSAQALSTGYRFSRFIRLIQQALNILNRIEDTIGLVYDIVEMIESDPQELYQFAILMGNAIFGTTGDPNNGAQAIKATRVRIPGFIRFEKQLPRKMVRKFRNLITWSKSVGLHNHVSEAMGEAVTLVAINILGFQGNTLRTHPVHGIDFLRKHRSGLWGIFEAKGGTSRLSNTITRSGGTQMSSRWIRHWINQTISENPINPDTDDLRRNHTFDIPMLAAVTRFNPQRVSWQFKLTGQFYTEKGGVKPWPRGT